MRTHIKETSKSVLLALCEGNSPVTGEFPTQRVSNAEKAPIWWHHHALSGIHGGDRKSAKLWVDYNDVTMSKIASQITSLTIVYSTVYSGPDQTKHQSSASLAFVWWIHRGPVNSPHKWPVTRKLFPFDDVIMRSVNPNNVWQLHFPLRC